MAALLAPRVQRALSRGTLRAADDKRLVAQVRAGSRAAFETVYDRHHAGLLAFCRHMLGSREEAEDVVQHTFAAAYQALLADDREIALKAWLYAIARNRCLSVLRGRREHVALDNAGARLTATAGLAAEVQQREDLRALLDDLQRLPDDQRAALVLAELGAMSHEEIGLILDVPAAKIKALVFQARGSLMNRHAAREADCGSIREQLAVARGGARRRGELRHHVAQCDGCRAFEAEVSRQRAAMVMLLPVAPTLALKQASLAGAFAAHGSAATAIGAGAGSAATGGTAAGVAASGATATGIGGSAAITGAGTLLSANIIGAKAMIALSLAGAAGGGYAAVQQRAGDRVPAFAGQVAAAHSGQSQKPGVAAPVSGFIASPVADGCSSRPAGACPSGGGGASAGRPSAGTADPPPAGCPAIAAGALDECRPGAPAPAVPTQPDGSQAGGSLPDGPKADGPKVGGSADGSKAGANVGDAAPADRAPADRDRDGVPDRVDRCPTKPRATAPGCPAQTPAVAPPADRAPADRDRDGVPDRVDRCPTKPGATAAGCPAESPAVAPPADRAPADRDGDGVPDRVDRCPTKPGVTAAGCPARVPASPAIDLGP